MYSTNPTTAFAVRDPRGPWFSTGEQDARHSTIGCSEPPAAVANRCLGTTSNGSDSQ